MLDELKKLRLLLTRRHRWDILALFAMMLVSALLEVVGVGAIPVFVGMVAYPERITDLPHLQNVLNYLDIGGDPRSLLIWAIVLLVLVFAIKNAFLAFQYYWQVRFIHNRRASISRRIVEAYMNAPYSFHLRRNTAELIRNSNMEAAVVATQVIGPLLEIATRGLILLAVLGILVAVEPLVTLGWLAIFGVATTLGIGALNGAVRRYGLLEQTHRRFALQALGQAYAGIKAIRVLNREKYFARKIDDSITKLAAANRFKQFVGLLMKPVTEFVGVTGIFAIAIMLVLLERQTETIVITLSLFIVALARFREAFTAIAAQYTTLRYSLVAVTPLCDDLVALEDQVCRQRETSNLLSTSPISLKEGIILDGVWYRYDGAERPALSGIDLNIRAGSSVGLVGGTGAGKSTLVDIILGLLKPEKGRVLVDGVEISGSRLAQWQRCVGYVPQTIYLMDDSIRNNIALGLEPGEIDEDAIRRAVQAAQLEDFVSQLPAGLDTFVGEQGVRLSGGERQRLGIARALYHDPEVLIMDEATSSLDNVTERLVTKAVERLKGRRTLITIAHRLSTVRHHDELHLLEDGRIVASGNYQELLDCSREFRTLASA